MNLDRAFLTAILIDGYDAVLTAMEQGITDEYFMDDAQKAWRFVLDYAKQYKAAPDHAMVEGSTGIKLPDTSPAPAEWFIEEIKKRRLHGAVHAQAEAIVDMLQKGDPVAAYQTYEDGLRDIRGMHLVGSRTVSLPSLGPEFLEFYYLVKGGFRGVLTPWESVNDATLGFWPEDFVLYVARLGIGKTWILTVIADHAWHEEKKRVLFATTEMAQVKIVQRWVAIHYKFPYNHLRKAQLSAFAEQKMEDGLKELAKEEGLYIIGGDFDFRIESLEAAIEECEPDIVVLDGAYLLKVQGDGRIEKAANSFDELKRCAKRNKIPLVASTQFNREVKGNKLASAGADKIALSDAAGWNADVIYGLIRTEDMVRDKRIVHKPLKYREGTGEDIECWFDFDLMEFGELPAGPQGAPGQPGGAGGAGATPAAQPASQGQPAAGDPGLFDFMDGDDGGSDPVPF